MSQLLMKIRHLIYCLMISGVFISIGWGQPSIFGYLESEWDQMKVGDEQYSFGYLKWRLDLEARPTYQILVAANLNAQRYTGQTQWNLLDFLPEQVWQSYFPAGQYPFTLSDTLYVDNAYMRLSFSRLDVTVGKQPLSLGTGYAWNPTDIFNVKDPLDPTYEQTGITALRWSVPIRDRFHLEGILAPDSTWEMSDKLLLAKLGLGRFDFTLQYADYGDVFPAWRYDTGQFEPVGHYQTVGGSVVGQLFGLGVWGEGVHSLDGSAEEFDEWLIGADYTLNSGTYFLAEYYHNGLGAEKNSVDFWDYAYYFTGETHSLLQNYMFGFIQHPISDFVSLGILTIANLDDESAVFSPQLDWNLVQNGTLSIWYSTAIGEKDTEFGLQESGVRIRLRIYY